MIYKKTVFILGAGTSLPYGFPSGEGLKDDIVGGLDRGGHLRDLLVKCGQSESHLNDFRTLLMQTFHPSIDAFVESRREFVDVARLACAAEILRREDETKLDRQRGDNSHEHWHAYLFQQLLPRTRLDDVIRNQLVILTFNFDRSFERALYRGLCSAYAEPESRLQNIAQALLPTHVHGSLGEPKWITASGLGYGENADDAETIKKAAGRLKLVFDDLTDADHRVIRRALQGVEQVCFLGFGYHDDNLRKLGLEHEKFSATTIRGTVRGMPSGRLAVLENGRFGKNRFHSKDASTLEMLKWLDYLHE